ncbi:23S rRNA (guanosine(2251)-2'-O)-methyltransferase RlmB [Helicobacter mesocricetorum]|uniref:23S rRNA (guanosine(2251)-2'-O)-methyltransferase RlmB n=1 Tax=Helicobacter mesocricetorum TaxID=87012 RepID=UPI002D77E20A|nr:23S rRNA (guanosine(2251)-2'-O)-methyltransferase RlmB [Helicobacter mesocricetorum]
MRNYAKKRCSMIVYGKQVVRLIVSKSPHSVQSIYLAKEVDKSFFCLLKSLNKPIFKLDAKKAQALAKGGNHQGYLLDITPLEFVDFVSVKEMNFIVVLCGISDVGNLGSIVRTSYALGVDCIVICGIKSFKQEGVLRASAGAFLEMPFCVVYNPLDVANELKQAGFTLYGADMQGSKKVMSVSHKKALFLGSENQGLSKRIIDKMDCILTISMKREFDSLNVSTAGAILIDRIINGRIG